jgi:hypothetical protein
MDQQELNLNHTTRCHIPQNRTLHLLILIPNTEFRLYLSSRYKDEHAERAVTIFCENSIWTISKTNQLHGAQFALRCHQSLSCSGIFQLLWNPKVHYRAHNSPPTISIRATSIKSTPPHHISLGSILILFCHIRRGIPTGLFPSSFPTNTLYAFLFSRMPGTCPVHHILPDFDRSNYIRRTVQVAMLLIKRLCPTSN